MQKLLDYLNPACLKSEVSHQVSLLNVVSTAKDNDCLTKGGGGGEGKRA